MALSAYVSSASAPAGTGSSALTGVGFQPKGVLALMTNVTATGSAASAHMGFGMTGTAAEDLNTYFNSLDGAASSDVVRSILSNAFIKVTDAGATTNRALATMTSLDSDGFTLNYTATTSGLKFPFLALGGSDITNVAAGQVAMSTGTTNFSVSGLGFQPDIVFLSCVLLTTTGTANNNVSISFGVARTTSERWCSVMAAQNAQATMNNRRGFYTDKCVLVSSVTSDATVDECDLVSMDSGGFTLSHPTASGSAYLINYLAIKGGQWKVGNTTNNTSTGNQSITGAGFTPVGALFCSSGHTSAGTITPTARMGVGFATSSTARRAYWCGDEDAAANALADSRYVEDKCLILYDEAGGGAPTSQLQADYVSNDSDGCTINITNTNGTAYNFGYVFFGSNASAGSDFLYPRVLMF